MFWLKLTVSGEKNTIEILRIMLGCPYQSIIEHFMCADPL